MSVPANDHPSFGRFTAILDIKKTDQDARDRVLESIRALRGVQSAQFSDGRPDFGLRRRISVQYTFPNDNVVEKVAAMPEVAAVRAQFVAFCEEGLDAPKANGVLREVSSLKGVISAHFGRAAHPKEARRIVVTYDYANKDVEGNVQAVKGVEKTRLSYPLM